MIRTVRLCPLPDLVAARLGTPQGPAVAIETHASNVALDDAVHRANGSPRTAIFRSASSDHTPHRRFGIKRPG